MSVVNQVSVVWNRAKAVGNKDGIHDMWKVRDCDDYLKRPRWLVVLEGGNIIAECKSREEARQEWKRLKGGVV